MEESLSQYFGRPTKSISVQINMQQQHSLAPFGLLQLNKITKCFCFKCTNQYSAEFGLFFVLTIKSISTVRVGYFSC